MELKAASRVENSLLAQKDLNIARVKVKIERIQQKTPHVDALQVLISKIQTVLVKDKLVQHKIASQLFTIIVVLAL